MVVPVLITNCHVSLKLNRGPVIIQATITPAAIENVIGRPVRWAVLFARCAYQVLFDMVIVYLCRHLTFG